ncbi:hypothetical protein LTR84_001263 [Exophiala bonariae]|uniref:Myb-like domain-containing protein n=1 Tax=Exophiala bonariae TaxID=1690606 RepID=A0AAV9NTI0_9EURO|nr:hypothetical protein LTR84_001263 [Exophiala bonariae]
MNSTFKITSAANQLDIIHYTVPPAVKPRRQQVPRPQEVMLQKCSLPDLTPNSLFDEPGESVNNPKSPTSNFADSPGAGCENLDSSTLEANFLESESTGENLFQKPVYLALLDTSLISHVSTAKESSSKGESTQYSPIGVGSIQSLAQKISSADLDVLEEPRKNSTMMGIQSTPVLKPQTMTLSSSGTETIDSTDCRDVQIDNAAEEGAKSDEDCDDGEVSLQISETEDSGLRYVDLIPSDLETSGIPSGPTPAAKQRRATEETQRSAKWSIRPVSPVGQSLRTPSTLHTTLRNARSSATIKVPRYKAGISIRPSHLERDYPSTTTKRKGPTMSATLSKRNRPLAGNPEARVLSDSESSDWAAGDDYYINEAKPKNVTQRRSTSRLSRPSKLLKTSGKRHDRGSVEILIPHRNSDQLQKIQKTPRESPAALQDNGVKSSPLSTLLTNLSVHPIRPDDSGYLTALVDDLTTVGPLLKSPAAFGLTDDIAVSLTNASVKPLTSALWLLTATISRPTQTPQSPKGRRLDSAMDSPSDDGASDSSERSSQTAHSIHHCPSDSETDGEIPQMTRGRWSKVEDKKLRDMKQSGEPWSEICEEFPDRTAGAVKARWYITLAPKSH